MEKNKNDFYELANEVAESLSKETTECICSSEWVKEIKKHKGTIDIFNETNEKEGKEE